MENIDKIKLAIVVVAFALIISGLLEIIFKFDPSSIKGSFIVGGMVGAVVVVLIGLVKKGRLKWLQK